MLAAGCVFLVGAVLMTAANGHLGMVYAGRGIAGLGIGAYTDMLLQTLLMSTLGSASLIIPVYISEIAPPSIRGRLVGIFEILSQGGSMLGFWINYIVDRTISSNTKTQWIVPLALQMVPGLFLLLGAAFAPESPRWLAKTDRWDKAKRNLHYLRRLPSDSNYVEAELQGKFFVPSVIVFPDFRSARHSRSNRIRTIIGRRGRTFSLERVQRALPQGQ
jgi:hypothetical protein